MTDTAALVAGVSCHSYVVTGDHEGVVRVWKPEQAQPSITIQTHDGPVRCLVLTADDEEVITSGNTSIAAWRLDSGERRATFVNHQGKSFTAGRAMVLHGGGERILTGSDKDGMPREWLIGRARLKTVHFAESCAGAATAVASDACGQRVFIGDSNGSIYVWKLQPYELSRTLNIGDPQGVAALATTPDGGELYVLGASDGVVGVIAPDIGEDHGTFETGGEKVRALALTADGSALLTGGEDGTVAIWDRAKRRLKAKTKGHEGSVCSVAASADSRYFVTAGYDGKARLWNSASGEPGRCVG